MPNWISPGWLSFYITCVIVNIVALAYKYHDWYALVNIAIIWEFTYLSINELLGTGKVSTSSRNLERRL